jgi:hypothetical protein
LYGIPVDDPIARNLTDWSGYYTLVGGMAATLLGLLFVAVSLRLDIFRRRVLADVREFATLIFGSFLVVIVIAALVLAPHGGSTSVTWVLLLAGLAGLFLIAWWGRVWIQVNLRSAPSSGGAIPGAQSPWQGVVTVGFFFVPYLGVLGSALLVATHHSQALGLLAISTGALLVLATVAAWVMLSHAGAGTATSTQPDS